MNSPGSPCVSPASCLHYLLTRLHLSLSQIVSSLPYYLVASLSFTSLHLHTFTSNYNFSITSITCHLSAASQLFTLRDQSTWTVCLRSGTPSHSSHQGRGIELVRAPSSGEYLSGGGKQKTHTEKEKKVRKCILALRGISCECEGSLRYEPDIKSDGGASGGFFKEIRWRATPHRHARSWFDSAAGRCAHIRIAPTVFFPLPASKKEPNAAL